MILGRYFLPLLAVLGMSLAAPSGASELVGKVVHVIDGDTLDVLVERNTHRIRLAGIDAPEKGQAFGDASRRHLAELVAGKVVRVETNKRDRFGRSVGKVWQDGVDVCRAQLDAGLAWHFKKYEGEQSREDRESYARAEVEARDARRGLWRDPAPLAPWEYRGR